MDDLNIYLIINYFNNLMNLKLSFSTQHLILDLFLTVIEGMKLIIIVNYIDELQNV